MRPNTNNEAHRSNTEKAKKQQPSNKEIAHTNEYPKIFNLPPRLYGLPKIHNYNVLLRPMYLTRLLQPHFVKILNGLHLVNDRLVSFDVV